MAADGEAQPRTAVFPLDRAVDLAETPEQPVELVRRDADARIDDLHPEVGSRGAVHRRDVERDRTRCRELHRVVKKVQEDLPQAAFVAQDPSRKCGIDLHAQVEPLRLG